MITTLPVKFVERSTCIIHQRPDIWKKFIKKICQITPVKYAEGLIQGNAHSKFILLKNTIPNNYYSRTIRDLSIRGLLHRPLVFWISTEGRWCSSTYMVVRLSDISSKTVINCIFCVFRLFLPLHRTASWPYRLSYINALRIN